MAPRVVVVVGTESGYTRMAMNKTIKGWKAGGVDVKQENVLEGSAAPETAEEFAELAKNFDVLGVRDLISLLLLLPSEGKEFPLLLTPRSLDVVMTL